MPKSQLKRTMEGAFIFNVASFIAKVLSAVYRVPLKTKLVTKGFTSISKSIQSMD